MNAFPVWDFIFLTASNEHQAESFRTQIDARREYLPKRTVFTVIPDEGGERVGSGGATLSVMKWLSMNGGWNGKRILVIHSGGDSKRVPQYSALGKLFSPVPHKLLDGRSSTLFDELIIAMSSVPGRIREGMLLLSGDVILLFNPLLIDWSGSGAAIISFKEKVEIGKDHGVYLRGEDGNVKAFFHKQSVETLINAGAVNKENMVDIDTGALLFGVDLLDSLFLLICNDGVLNINKYYSFVNEKVRLSLYGDFQYPLAKDSTLQDFFLEKGEVEYSEALKDCRTAVWNALRGYSFKLLRLAPAKFIHFGTTREILQLMNSEVDNYADLGWGRSVNSTGNGYNSVVDPKANVGIGVYSEVSYIHSDATVGDHTVLSYIDIHNETIPPHVVLHGLKQRDGNFVCRIYGIDDNPKENRLFGHIIPETISHSLWTAPIYPERKTIKEAVATALALYEKVQNDEWNNVEFGKSLASGFADADPQAILDWNKRMEELVAMNRIQTLIDMREPATKAVLQAPLTKIQKEWYKSHLDQADYSRKMRLYYYIGCALKDEEEVAKSFHSLSSAIVASAVQDLYENKNAKIIIDEIEVSLPLRVNFGGGWSDTPPYCNENGGTVLNASILLNGTRPVTVRIKKTDEKKIVFESKDMDVHGEFSSIEPLQNVGDPFDSFVLQKAALLACGVIPRQGGNLGTVLNRLGGGFWMDTEVTGVPKGSGLGTSSILAAACVKALLSFIGISYTEEMLYERVLVMEQIMSTGGGWQDQVGGVTNGLKFITSRPGLYQKITVDHLSLMPETLMELNQRFCLIYTGQRRLARNLLRDVVGRYIGNEPDTIYALNEIQRIAALMRFELERGNIDAFADLLSQHWDLSKMIDGGSTNTLIDQIFDSVDDLLNGKMVCGAGGGGFLQVILKKGVSREQLQNRLKEIFADTDINVWEANIC